MGIAIAFGVLIVFACIVGPFLISDSVGDEIAPSNWRVGQSILCIKSHRSANRGAYVEGKVYTIKRIIKGCKHTPILFDISLDFQSYNFANRCPECYKEYETGCFLCNAKNFIPYNDK